MMIQYGYGNVFWQTPTAQQPRANRRMTHAESSLLRIGKIGAEGAALLQDAGVLRTLDRGEDQLADIVQQSRREGDGLGLLNTPCQCLRDNRGHHGVTPKAAHVHTAF